MHDLFWCLFIGALTGDLIFRNGLAWEPKPHANLPTILFKIAAASFLVYFASFRVYHDKPHGGLLILLAVCTSGAIIAIDNRYYKPTNP